MPCNQLYSLEFFGLQLQFATKVAKLSGLPLAETVGSHTNIYVRLGMGPRLDPTNPAWLEYVSALVAAQDPVALTYEIHRQRAHFPAGPEMAPSVGCFSYTSIDASRVRLHFHAGTDLAESPLSPANEGRRRRELFMLLSHVAALGSDVQVVGASWLYNLSSYRRLFPERYLSSLAPMEHPYQRMPLWGQFLNRDKTVRAQATQHFHSHLARAVSLAELTLCFPLRVLSATAPAMWLLAHAEAQQSDAR